LGLITVARPHIDATLLHVAVDGQWVNLGTS
jgi:hypothetical protein